MGLVLIDNFDSFTYNLYQMLQMQTQQPVTVFRNNAIDYASLQALKPSHIVLSPGPGHPSIADDFGVCADIVKEGLKQSSAHTIPVLGVCLGHQGLVHYAGGEVLHAPKIVHGKTSMVSVLKESPLFDGMSRPFQAMRYHSFVVDRASLPACFEVTSVEPSEDLIMSVQHRTLPLYGVQFHPESIGTPEGALMLRNFLEKC